MGASHPSVPVPSHFGVSAQALPTEPPCLSPLVPDYVLPEVFPMASNTPPESAPGLSVASGDWHKHVPSLSTLTLHAAPCYILAMH